jgi:hypothetical protein
MKKELDLSTKPLPERLVLEFFNRVWCPPHELDAIDELMTDDYTITTAGVVVKGRDAFKSWVGGFQKLLLEAKNESLDIFYNEAQNKVVSRWTSSGKNNGLFGLQADNKFVSFSGIAIWSIRDNRLSECWVERSAYELYKNLTSKVEQFV